jgi:hypothetical protein
MGHEGGDDMGLTKHGTGEIIQGDEDLSKTASPEWTKEDEEGLKEELEQDVPAEEE